LRADERALPLLGARGDCASTCVCGVCTQHHGLWLHKLIHNIVASQVPLLARSEEAQAPHPPQRGIGLVAGPKSTPMRWASEHVAFTARLPSSIIPRKRRSGRLGPMETVPFWRNWLTLPLLPPNHRPSKGPGCPGGRSSRDQKKAQHIGEQGSIDIGKRGKWPCRGHGDGPWMISGR
jgi:hypothetical protein